MDVLLSLSTVIVQAINLAIVLFVLKKYLFTPYLAHLDEEAKKRADLELKSRDAEALVVAAKSEAQGILSEAKKDAATIRSGAESQAKISAQDILSRAEREASATRSRAVSDMESEKRSLERELTSRVMDVALSINAKVFGKQSAAHKDLVSELSKNAQL